VIVIDHRQIRRSIDELERAVRPLSTFSPFQQHEQMLALDDIATLALLLRESRFLRPSLALAPSVDTHPLSGDTHFRRRRRTGPLADRRSD
jgi:hypothetical protein